METIDDVLNRIGFGRFNIILLVILGGHYAILSSQIVIVALLGPVLSCYWKLNAFDVSIFTTVAFVGMSIGSLIIGYLTDKYCRKSMLILSNCGLIYCIIISTISPTFYWFTIIQFFNGCFTSGLIVSIFPLLAEFSPIKYRGTLLVSLQFFRGIGSLWMTFLCFFIFPTLGWRILLILSTIQIIILSLLLVYIPQSPRLLLLHNQKVKCIEIINHIAKLNGSDPIKDLYEPPSVQSSFLDLIHSKFLSTTILTSIMSFNGSLTLFSIILLTTYISNVPHRCLQNRVTFSQVNYGNSTIDDSCCFNMSWKNYENMFISVSAEIIFVPLSFVLINLIGRKKTFAIYSIINALGIFLLNFCLNSNLINVVLFVLRGSALSYVNVGFLYATEVYSTSVRGLGNGICNSSSKIGGILAPLNLIIILKFSFLSGTMLLVALNSISFFLSFILPYETKDRQLMQSANDDLNDFDHKVNLNKSNYQTINK